MTARSVLSSARQSADVAGTADRNLTQTLGFLADPASHHPAPARVEAIETHMSWVFLTADLAYKLKKPVTYPFLDFGTLAAREADCRDEMRLNRRLAPGVYLGLTRVERDDAGRLVLVDENGVDSGAGKCVDWLVRMRRLPADRTLEDLIRQGTLGSAQVGELGALLASFYRHLAPADLDPAAQVARLHAQHVLNSAALTRASPPLDGAVVQQVLDGIAGFLHGDRPLLEARATEGRIVEGHGDLRPEHVFMLDAPVVIDCLEFNREMRLVDWVDEIAFLGMECDRLGAAWVGPALRRAVGDALGDAVSDRLFDFYAALRACLRARLALAHLDEPAPRTPARWPALAAQYLGLAQQRIARLATTPARVA
jgi:aminoglycoside phosphotransferase family enzyme